MQVNCLRTSFLTFPALVFLSGYVSAGPVDGNDHTSTVASEHVQRAEEALRNNDYLMAATEYRKAAEQGNSVEIARKATRLGFAYKFNDQSLLAARRWVKLDKESDEAHAFLGILYFRADKLRDARRQFERLIKASDKPGSRLLSLVGNLSDEDLPQRAHELIRSLAKRYPKSASAHYAVAILALQAGDSEHAKNSVRRSLELEPDNLRPRLLYARALLLDGDNDAAVTYLAHLIGDSARPDPDARMELALVYMMTGRDDDALSQVNQVLLEQSGRADALRLMAIINFRLQRHDAAWDDFQDLLVIGKYRMDALYYLARISDYRSEYERAVRLYREVRHGSNTVFSQRRASALLAHELGDVQGALELLDKFAASSPNNAVDMVATKAQLLVSLKRFDEGMTIYDKAIKFRPDNIGLILGRAELLLQTGDLEKSLTHYRDAVKRWPDNALALNALGYTLADRTDELLEAETLIEKALQLDPENAAIIDSMGWLLHRLGRDEEALPLLESAYRRFPDPEVAAHLVAVMVNLDKHDEALILLREAEEQSPDSELLQRARSRYFPDQSD